MCHRQRLRHHLLKNKTKNFNTLHAAMAQDARVLPVEVRGVMCFACDVRLLVCALCSPALHSSVDGKLCTHTEVNVEAKKGLRFAACLSH